MYVKSALRRGFEVGCRDHVHNRKTMAPFQKELAILKTTLKTVYIFCNNCVVPVPETLSRDYCKMV